MSQVVYDTYNLFAPRPAVPAFLKQPVYLPHRPNVNSPLLGGTATLLTPVLKPVEAGSSEYLSEASS